MTQLYEVFSITTQDVTVLVQVDYVKETVSLVDKGENDRYRGKQWMFANRGLAYQTGWAMVLDAIEAAMAEGFERLQRHKDESLKNTLDIIERMEREERKK